MRVSSAPVLDSEGFDPELCVDENDMLVPGEVLEPGWGEDIFTSGAAHDVAVGDVGEVTVGMRRLAARQWALFARVLADAAACPDPWCGPDPTLDPHWVDPRDRSIGQVRAERREMAVRAAVCDLAVRTHLSETLVRSRAADAELLQERCPTVWAAFVAGDVDDRTAAITAGLARSLPADDPDSWARFDAAVAGPATVLPAGKFRTRAHAARERAHTESLQTRHIRAQEDRGVWLDPDLDGMATLHVCAPATDLHAAYARADQYARHLHETDGESRTLAQLRADITVDLLTRGHTDTTTAAGTTGKPAVAITVPVLTLLGLSEEPAVLDGYGPIDTDTAKKLAGDATSWVRILTHPVTGTILTLDRTTYPVTNALRRWLGARDPVCTFPGCGRLVRDCEIDHRTEWHQGGTTDADNTGPLCKPHHRVKTETRWNITTTPDGTVQFRSPTGITTDTDPPPW